MVSLFHDFFHEGERSSLAIFGKQKTIIFASRSLDVYVNKLRKLFANDASVQMKTFRGVGIMLEVLS